MRKRNIYSIISLWCVLFFCPTLHAERKGFAVVIDSISYQQAQHELAEYIRALESKQLFYTDKNEYDDTFDGTNRSLSTAGVYLQF